MRLRTALNEYKRDRGERFPEERPTVDGAFSGHGDRLVYVDSDGSIRDYSSALSGLYGIDRSRFGIETREGTRWFDELNPVRQHYYRETSLVETEFDAGSYTVHQYDLTLGRAHVTHVELRGAVPRDAHLTAFLTLSPGGRETRVGRLIHEHAGPNGTKAVEVFHRTEHDYVTASTGLDDVRGQIPERFDEMLSEEAYEFPREAVLQRYEDTHLSGDVVVSAPLESDGRSARTTLVTQLSDHDEVSREDALADLRHCADAHSDADALRSAARERAEVSVPADVSRPDLVRADLRALSLLKAPTGAHVAGPEFDPFYSHSGGYGYTWFRDESEAMCHLLGADSAFDLGADGQLWAGARFFCETQLDDGTWPHRVWAVDGSLAPGWANARVEDSESPEYQADQTASVTTFLATLLRERGAEMDDDLARRVREALAAAVDGLDDSMAADDLPEECQNAWENMIGRFTHTAATFLRAYAAVARAPLDEGLRERAAGRARRAFSALDLLWDDDREVFALRSKEGARDSRLDSSTFALVEAFREYDALDALAGELDALDATETVSDPAEGSGPAGASDPAQGNVSAEASDPPKVADPDGGFRAVDDEALDRLVAHVETTLSGLYRESPHSDVAGLIRFEGDYWRSAEQDDPKVWSVATAWGAYAAASLGAMLEQRRGDGAMLEQRREDAATFFERAADLYELLGLDGPLSTNAGYLAEQAFDDGTLDSAAPLGWPHAVRLHTTALLEEHQSLPVPKAAPSGPTGRPRWTTGEKYGIGTVPDHESADPSRVWFTLTQGALTEVRFPRVDLMNLRTLDLLVVDADPDAKYTARTYNETRRDDRADTVERRAEITEDDALAFRHVVTETGDGRGHEWTLTVEYAVDPEHDALLADVRFEAQDGNDYQVFAVADTALTNRGTTDRALRLGQSGGYHLVARDSEAFDETAAEEPLLIDEEGEEYSVAVALTARNRFDWGTVGVAGSEHLHELFSRGTLPEPREQMDNESVVLIGRLGAGRAIEETLALGFAENADTAAALGEAAGALTRGFERVRTDYVDAWRGFLADRPLPESVAGDPELANQYRAALMSLKAVEDKTFLGASIASPSVPWGEAVTAEESKGYGYNFVWSRDLYQVFTVFDAVDDVETAVDELSYIYNFQQDERGFIPQNTYLNGRTRWGGEQMDNISFPQVMAYALRRRGIGFEDVDFGYENVRRSADYVARNGPATAQERWEEESGYSPSSIAAEIAGLVCAGAIADDEGHLEDALVWYALADDWAAHVEEWCATDTGTVHHENVPYYVRITRDGDPDAGHLRTLANDGPTLDEREIIDAGFLELVRLGIKPADDPVVRNSVAEVDRTIRVDTPGGPAFYRYNGDGYGEQGVGDEGAPWTIAGKGKGRLWPIFTGERAEYELLVDDHPPELEARNLLRTMASFANSGRMLAEQVWDREHATRYNWEFGEGTGSATPLAWSMAQFCRLAHGVDAGEPVETPAVVRERYLDGPRPSGPVLEVDTHFEGDDIVVTGETDGVVVAVKTPSESFLVTPEDDAFEVTLGIEYGENQITVAAATDENLSAAGTTVTRFTL